MTDDTPALRLEGIVKTFPGVRALDGVSFSVMPGEVHALMGENGAGKSTLMKVLGGIHQPDAGKIIVGERPVVMSGPLEAKAKGIVFIHQELSLAEELTVAENIYLGELPKKSFGRVDWATLFSKTDAILKKLNVGFGAKTRVGSLSIANQQMVEIARALTVDAKAVIFDEPTASLTDAEKVVLFEVISDLQAQGVGIAYISHRMEEIFKITDRISVLRDGQYQGTVVTAETNEEGVTQMMIGRKLDLSRNESHHELGDVALEVRGLSCGKLYQDVSFEVRRGEVVGFYGLVGAGRTEIAETLFGLRDPSAGTILMDGEEVRIHSPVDAIAKGISLVPEDRKTEGLMLGMPIADNLLASSFQRISRGPFIDPALSRQAIEDGISRLQIKAGSASDPVMTLSGGNQQKVVIAKWLMIDPDIILLNDPTRGIDVGTKQEIYRLMRDLANQGKAILFYSSDYAELIGCCDRVSVLYSGRIVAEKQGDDITEESLVAASLNIDVEAA